MKSPAEGGASPGAGGGKPGVWTREDSGCPKHLADID